MSGSLSSHQSLQLRHNPRYRNFLEPIEEKDRSMEMEDTPVKQSRERACTIGYESPNPKRIEDTLNQYTCSTYRRLHVYYSDTDKGVDQINSEIHLDNAIHRLGNIRYTNFLDRHHIEEKFRARMIDWMIEVLNTYQQKESTLYRSIFLLDYYYYCTKNIEVVEDLHLTGIACMMIASKSEEIEFIKVNAFLSAVGKNKFTKDDLLNRELEVLSGLQFKTCGPTLYELLKCCFQVVDIKNQALKSFFEKCALILSKMCLFSYQLINTMTISEIALNCVIISLKMSEKIRRIDSNLIVR